MSKSNIFTVLFFTLGMIVANFNLILINFTTDNSLIDNNTNNKANIFNFQDEMLQSADYSSSFAREAGDINITLHQSLLNTSLIQISNVSDPTNNSFIMSCPTDTTFNSPNFLIYHKFFSSLLKL